MNYVFFVIAGLTRNPMIIIIRHFFPLTLEKPT